MRIAFCCQHLYYGGLADNGGSQTIIKACHILNRMGHSACIVTKVDKHTWIKHDKPVKHIPRNVDVVIACSVSDIEPMLKTKPQKAKAYWWCRLREDYQMPKRKILQKADKVRVLVNSEGLQFWLKRHGINSQILYQGYDKKWNDFSSHYKNYVGFLVSNKKRKNFDLVKKIVKKLGAEYKYVGFGNDISGSVKRFVKKHFTYFVENADYNSRLKIYNSVRVWVSTSTSEGLHNCPIEAALCGCAIAYPDSMLAGCSDHCIDTVTAWRYEASNTDSAIKAIERANRSRNKKHIEVIKDKIGTRRQNMVKLIEILQKERCNGIID